MNEDELDKRIRSALKDDQPESPMDFMSGDDEDLFDMIKASFQTKRRSLVILVWTTLFVISGFWVWSMINFFSASAVEDYLFWGLITLMLFIYILGVKIWYWNEMNRNSVIREIKRLELKLAHFEDKLAK